MVVAKVSLKFKNLKTGERAGFGQNVIDQLVINAGPDKTNPFPNLPYSTDELQAVTDALTKAVTNMQQGGKTASAALKAAMTDWKIYFTATANYVSMVAKGSEVLIAMAGFNSTKTNKSKKPLAGGINGFSARVNHNKGAVTVGAKTASSYADGYLFAAAPEGAVISYNGDILVITIGNSSVFLSATTKREIDLKQMPKGIVYNFTMMAFNAAGTGAAAAPQEVIPQ